MINKLMILLLCFFSFSMGMQAQEKRMQALIIIENKSDWNYEDKVVSIPWQQQQKQLADDGITIRF